MRLVHWRENARTVANRWRKQYKGYAHDYRFPDGYTVGDTVRLLETLDPETASVGDYDHMRHWVEPECSECGAKCESIVRIGDEPDYDALWQDLCGDCLAKAAALIPPHTP